MVAKHGQRDTTFPPCISNSVLVPGFVNTLENTLHQVALHRRLRCNAAGSGYLVISTEAPVFPGGAQGAAAASCQTRCEVSIGFGRKKPS